MSDLRIQHTEEMVGAGHASKADTLNRLALAEHNNDGTHKKLTQVIDPWVDVRAYGAVGDGATDDTTAITGALAYASSNKLGVKLEANKTYLVSNLTIAGTGNVPLYVDLNGSTIKAKTGATGALVTIENPHSKVHGFRLENGIIDSNSQADNALYVHGMQHGRLRNLKLMGSVSHNLKAYAESGYGVYYSSFTDVFSTGGAGVYFGSNPAQATSRFNANTLINIVSHYSTGSGITMEYANQNYLRAVVEQCQHHGINLLQVVYNLRLDGYVENHGLAGAGYYGLNLATNVWNVDYVGKLTTGSSGKFGGTSLLNNGHQITLDNQAGFQRWFSALSASYGKFGVNDTGTEYHRVAMAPDYNGLKLGDGTAAPWISVVMGTGSPEGAVTAYKGSLYLRYDGGAGTCLYVKESGTGNTGWVAK